MKNNIEKLEINVTEEQMKNPSIAYDVRVRKKINEILDLTDERTKARDKQIDDIQQDLIALFNRIEKIEKELKIG